MKLLGGIGCEPDATCVGLEAPNKKLNQRWTGWVTDIPELADTVNHLQR